MASTPRTRWIVYLPAIATLALALVVFRNAVSWYERPIGGAFIDPDGAVSNLGLPTWDGFQQGLGFPDRVVEVDGEPLGRSAGEYHASAWDRAVDRAARAGRSTVHARVETVTGPREVDLAVRRLDPAAWWLYAGGLFLIAGFYVGAALIAISASPRGPLARTFAKTAILAALFLFTLFDYHTTRALVPLFEATFAMVPMAFISLALRLPDDVALLRRWPWLVAVLDAAGLGLALAMVFAHASGGTSLGLRAICAALFGASFLFFAGTFLVRFVLAKGERRQILRALLVAIVPPHVAIGLGHLLAHLFSSGSVVALATVPAMALTPLSTVVAFVRHDLWGSRALLSRVFARGVIIGLTSLTALAAGTVLATAFGAELKSALIASAIAAVIAAPLVLLALRAGDRRLFPARAEYKPTVAELSEELTSITDPAEVSAAIERTVRRWLSVEQFELEPAGAAEAGGGESAEPEPDEASGARVIQRSTSGDVMRVPVAFGGKLLGTLCAGKKLGGALFTSEDLDLLRTIANQGALALAHAQAYAELEERRREEAAAWRGERAALVETLAAEIVHEVRYPINYFRTTFERVAAGGKLDSEDIDIGAEEVGRLERLVQQLLRAVSGKKLDRRPTRIADLVHKAETLLRERLGGRPLHAVVHGDVAVRCDPDQATQVMVNLLANALDAAGPGGQVGVEWASSASGGELVVWDDGPGFTGDPKRIFAPWYTTKPTGTGLGLAITSRIVRAHGWDIEATHASGKTRFAIAVPPADLVRPTEEVDVA